MKRNEFIVERSRSYADYVRYGCKYADLWEHRDDLGTIHPLNDGSDIRWFNFLGYVYGEFKLGMSGKIIGDSDES